MQRRKFINQLGVAGIALNTLSFSACKNESKHTKKMVNSDFENKFKNIPAFNFKSNFFNISLAQSSLKNSINAGLMDPYDFALRAKQLGFEGADYVNQLFKSKYENASNMLDAMKKIGKELLTRSKNNGITNHLILIDDEGKLAQNDDNKRLEAVANHYKWIDLAGFLGCQSVRVNLFGDGMKSHQIETSILSLRQLCEYAVGMGVNILIENQGGNSSDPNFVAEIIERSEMKNIGTLPDFGNFCLKYKGDFGNSDCAKEYNDKTNAFKALMSYAKAVSAKSYAFGAKGNETTIDYEKMLGIAKKSKFNGFVGVDYNGNGDEVDGILKTRDLLAQLSNKIEK